jgi:phosphopentomutase
MGLPLDKPFPLYPEGFPPALVHKLEVATGSKFIGNIPASGTEIIAELGEEHIRSGALILYTSADSVLQIAAHEQVVPVAELYQICRIIRGIMTGENAVARVIARPFIGEPGAFIRTANRHDFSLEPPDQTVLDLLEEAGITTIGIGKIYDLFGGKGIKVSIPTRSNSEGIKKTIEITSSTKNAFIFTNLVDFDMLWGHRNDPEGFYSGLREFDLHLPRILESLKIGDLLILTADHGVDPTTPSTDHSREYVPLLVWKPELNSGVNLGTRETFADVGASVADFFQIEGTWWGISFLPELYA